MRIAHATLVSSPLEQILAVRNDHTPLQNEFIPPEANWEEKISHFPIPSVTNYNVDLTKSALSPYQKEYLNIMNSHSKAFVGPAGHLGHYNGPI
ncbi:unnamed protein product [Strongylus vulgaris]|uniref:Uncharacterized protein n=1 Tax=Strongylus vulgaris TaxID=40348 RepID=A0A3P7J556_STRVU|nr:unnamed protein product [Strongylus vulgaris]